MDGASDLPKYFFKVMVNDFGNEMVFPPDYSRVLRRYAPNMITLDSGRGIWKVMIELNRQSLQLAATHGWRQFVENHDIRVGYFLVFKRAAGLLFGVTIYGYNFRNIVYDDLPMDMETVLVDRAGSFILRIKRYHGYRNPAVHLPVAFTNRVRLHEKEAIEVLDEDGIMWPLQIRKYYDHAQPRCYAYKGWDHFYAKNGMQIGQLWLLELIRHEPQFKTSALRAKRLR